MPYLADGVWDTTETTGTGTVTVSGTPSTGYAALSTIATGTVVDYAIRHRTAAEYETGRGTVASGTTLSRDSVSGSSNSDAPVNFSSGVKDVAVTVIGRSIATRGRVLASPYALR